MIVDGELVNAAVTNAKLMSRTADTSTVGKINLENSDSPIVIDVQRQVNLGRTVSFSTQTISSSTTVTSDNLAAKQVIPLVSDGGEVELSGAIFGGVPNMEQGRVITLVGTNNTNYVKLTQESNFASIPLYGIMLNGSIELALGVVLTLLYIEIDGKLVFLEIGRNV